MRRRNLEYPASSASARRSPSGRKSASPSSSWSSVVPILNKGDGDDGGRRLMRALVLLLSVCVLLWISLILTFGLGGGLGDSGRPFRARLRARLVAGRDVDFDAESHSAAATAAAAAAARSIDRDGNNRDHHRGDISGGGGRNHEEEEEGLSACLLVNDENPRLPEWIAYHYHVLPLRSLTVAVDPASRSSPDEILERWRGKGNGNDNDDVGLRIDSQVWEEKRYMPYGGDGACDASDPDVSCSAQTEMMRSL